MRLDNIYREDNMNNRILQRLAADLQEQNNAFSQNTNSNKSDASKTNLDDDLYKNDPYKNFSDTSNRQQNPFAGALEEIDPNTVKEVKQLLARIRESSNNLKDIYYALFDNLNALFSAYPSIYQQLQMTVKLPTNNDAMNTVQFNNDLTIALNKFKDPVYLASYLKNSSDTID